MMLRSFVDGIRGTLSPSTPPADLPALPVEVWIHILGFVDCKTQVKSCRLVSRAWRDLVETETLKLQAIRSGKVNKKGCKASWSWVVLYHICESGLLDKNFIVNPCGKDKFKGWQMVHHGGVEVECPPSGTSDEDLPLELCASARLEDGQALSCFATSFQQCFMQQLIHLTQHKVKPFVMDRWKPVIEVSQWFAPRFDCGSVYTMSAELLDKNKKSVMRNSFHKQMEQWTEAKWQKASFQLKDYPDGVRYIRFIQEGKDTQFWAGNYGSKMTCASICFRLDTDTDQKAN